MTDLQLAAKAIDDQLKLSYQLSNALTSYGHTTTVVEAGTVDAAKVDDMMVDAYNNAINNVLNTSYLTAQDVLMEQHQIAVNNLDTAINALVSATTVLATVSTVADMAASADTSQEQLQVQAALATTDMSIDQADVDKYNNALDGVENYAQQAAGFLAAATDSSITGAIDNFAAQNNLTVAAYSAVTYTQSIDQILITWDNNSYMSFAGYNSDNIVTAEEVYGQIGYVGG